MMIEERYEAAKEAYRAIGVDTDAALEALAKIPVSMHCWQGDDVAGFDNPGQLSGGIQATGNYPGKARKPEELMADIDEAVKPDPGKAPDQSPCQLRDFRGWRVRRPWQDHSQSILQNG